MLEYLVTSRTRRALLHLLWVESRTGSVSALARASGVNFSAVHRELDAMKDAGLALAERVGPALEYRANSAHPAAGTLLQLLAPTVHGAARADPRVCPHDRSPEDRVIDDPSPRTRAKPSLLLFPAPSGGSGTRSTTAA